MYQLVFIAILHVVLWIHSNSFPQPLYSNERAAIMISGELRSGNIPIVHLHDENKKTKKMLFGSRQFHTVRNTPIMTVLTNLIAPFARHGGVDVFLNIVAYPQNTVKPRSSHPLPWTYPIIHEGDTRPCELFSNHSIFGKHTDNNIFCKVKVPQAKSNLFIRQNPIWDNYCFGHVGIETFLQQEYGKYEANLAAKQYAIAKGIKYKYKIRSRFDLAFISSFPNISALAFTNQNCSSIVYYPNRGFMGLGAEDSFNIGLAEDMDPILDRYMDLIAGPVHNIHENNKSWWNSEAHLVQNMRVKRNLCLVSLKALAVSKMRTIDYKHSYETYLRPANEWVYMNQSIAIDSDMPIMNASIHVTNRTCLNPGQEERIMRNMTEATKAMAIPDP